MKSFTTHITTVLEVHYSGSRLQRIRQQHYHSYKVHNLHNISVHYQVSACSDDDDDDSDSNHDDWIISMYIEYSEYVVEILKLAIRTLFSWVNV
jgi:hypothetical protein